MNEVLARIKVRETHGIRRFLYPLTAYVALPGDEDFSALSLTTLDGPPIPLQTTPEDDGRHGQYSLHFAVSMAPHDEQELLLTRQGPRAPVPNPLHLTFPPAGNALQSAQEHLNFSISREGFLRQVVYSGIEHLRATSLILRNGQSGMQQTDWDQMGSGPLAAWVEACRLYDDGGAAQTRSEITACKSWVNVQHIVSWPQSGDEIVFYLPLAVTSSTLTCDFGAGGGIYGKLQAGVIDEIVWRSEFAGDEVRWSITTAGRVDYVGKVKTAEAFLPQRWFHVIDLDKALAVAITAIPEECWEMTITLQCTGDVQIAFRLGENAKNCEYAIFGACYHFLNDVPAIAAATNPQSILLPPLVEALPV